LKKPIAALLLTIYLFSVGGQLALHPLLSYFSDRFFEEQTSKGLYNTGDLTEVKIPVNMPNIADWREYENINGQINFENVSYNYVKMKITRTAMYLMCVPNYTTTKLSHQNIIEAKQSGKTAIPKKEHVPHGKTTFTGICSYAFTQFAFSSFVKTLRGTVVHPTQRLAFQYRDVPWQPPKFSC
jgi:hypothetical protein